MTIELENGGIQRIIHNSENTTIDPSFSPVLQILNVSPINSKDQKRWRTVLSDGTHFCQGMLATQHNNLVDDGKVKKFTIIRANDFMRNTMANGAHAVILLNLSILENPGYKIGNPVKIANSAPPQDRNGNVNANANANANTNGNGNSSAHFNGNGARPVPTSSSSSVQSPSNPYARSNSSSRSNAPIQRMTGSAGGERFTPISSLNQYINRWTIKARVTDKSDIRTWSNQKGEGTLFSVTLLDASGVDIKATFFREGVDRFHPMLQFEKVYTFSGGMLKAANLQYNTCKSKLEITFDQNAEIKLAEDGGEIIQQGYDFKPIANLDEVEPGKYVDVIGVVKRVSEPMTIVSKKTQKELKKCELTVADDSGAEVSCTVWGERAMNAPNEFAGEVVVAFRRARVSDYGGRTLSASGGYGINPNPNVMEADRIRAWWAQGGSSNGNVKRLTVSGGANRFPEFDTRKSIMSIKSEQLGFRNPDKADFISFKGTVSFIKSDREGGAWYPACPNADEPCKNRYKVTQGSDGRWQCEKCNKTYDNCKHRFIFSATISDESATTWVSVFDDQAMVLLDGMTADELNDIYQGGANQSDYNQVFKKAQFKDWVFTCKVKQEFNQDEARIKTSIQSLHKMDYAKEGRSLLNSILSM